MNRTHLILALVALPCFTACTDGPKSSLPRLYSCQQTECSPRVVIPASASDEVDIAWPQTTPRNPDLLGFTCEWASADTPAEPFCTRDIPACAGVVPAYEHCAMNGFWSCDNHSEYARLSSCANLSAGALNGAYSSRVEVCDVRGTFVEGIDACDLPIDTDVYDTDPAVPAAIATSNADAMMLIEPTLSMVTITSPSGSTTSAPLTGRVLVDTRSRTLLAAAATAVGSMQIGPYSLVQTTAGFEEPMNLSAQPGQQFSIDAGGTALGWTATSATGQEVSFGVTPTAPIFGQIDLSTGTWMIGHTYTGAGWSIDIDLAGSMQRYRTTR